MFVFSTQLTGNRNCQWLDSNRGSMVVGATVLAAVSQKPLPIALTLYLILEWYQCLAGELKPLNPNFWISSGKIKWIFLLFCDREFFSKMSFLGRNLKAAKWTQTDVDFYSPDATGANFCYISGRAVRACRDVQGPIQQNFFCPRQP